MAFGEETVRFNFEGTGNLPKLLLDISDRSEFAAKASKTLTSALEKQKREEGLTADEAAKLAAALRATGDAEAKVAAKSLAADAAIRRLDDSMKKAGDSGGRLHAALKKTGSILGGIGAGGGLFAGGAAGIAAAGPFAGLGASLLAFGAIAKPELTKIEQAMQKTGKARKTAFAAFTPQEKQLANQLTILKDQFHGLEAQMAPLITAVVKVAGAFLKDALPAFKLLATVGGNALETILGYLGQFLRSPAFKEIAKQLGQLASQIAPLLGKQLVALLKVFLQLFIQVGPAGIKLLRALLPAITELVASLTPVIVAVANIVAAMIQWLAKNHLLIPALTLLAAGVLAVTLAMDTNPILLMVSAIAVLAAGIVYLVKHWGTVWGEIKRLTADAWHWLYDNVFAKLITFFTKTIPTVFDIFKETVRIAWDEIKIHFLQGVLYILNIMGKLPGPLGAPFRSAAKDIHASLAGIQSDVARAAKNIQGDFDSLHGKVVGVDIKLGAPPPGKIAAITRGFAAKGVTGAAAGTWLVGEEGPELAYLPQGTNVIPAGPTSRIMGGLASGTPGWQFTDKFIPSVGAFTHLVNSDVNTLENAIANAMAKAAERAMLRGGFGHGHPLSGAGIYSQPALEALWVGAGGPASLAHLMAAIADAESGGNPNAYNPSGASGLWQILGQIVPGNIFNPVVNAENAVAKWRSQGLGAWVTYTNGAYKQYYDQGGYLRPGWTMAYNGTGRNEQVLSPRQSGGGTVNINVHVSADASMHPAETGRIIADRLKAHVKRGGTLYPAGVTPR